MNISVLDHGYVKFIETWGSDERIVEAARMSTAKGFKGWGNPIWHCASCNYALEHKAWRQGPMQDRPPCPVSVAHVMSYEEQPGDEKLLHYLYEHRHMTPFEMAGMTIEVQAPIFVFREWHRHRTQSYNELSARYTPLPDLNYVPSTERLMMTSATNKQAQAQRSDLIVTKESAEALRALIVEIYGKLKQSYQVMLDEGTPKELARLILPVGRYSRMRASTNLRNWLQFLTLRMDQAAQWEIRQYANAVGSLVAAKFSRTWELFNK